MAVGTGLVGCALPEPTPIGVGVLVDDGISGACVVAVPGTGVSVGGKGVVAAAGLRVDGTGVGDAVGVAVAVGVCVGAVVAVGVCVGVAVGIAVAIRVGVSLGGTGVAEGTDVSTDGMGVSVAVGV